MIKRKSLDIFSFIAVAVIFLIPFSFAFFWVLGVENPFLYYYLTIDFKPNAGLTFYGQLCAVIVMVLSFLVVLCQQSRIQGVFNGD